MFDRISKTANNNPTLVSALSESLQNSGASPHAMTYRSPGIVTASCVQHLGQQLMGQTQSRSLISDYRLAIGMVHLADLLPENRLVKLPELGEADSQVLKTKAAEISPWILDPGLMQPQHQFRSSSLEREIDLLAKEVTIGIDAWKRQMPTN
ncbi:MAG TPA: hypothetical protein VFV43_10935 [Limnobacter sp.]|nr:hypothetical protein [Limnobacter sp.]